MLSVQLYDFDRLGENKIGILEPNHEVMFKGTFDIILVPGLAFSEDGFRIGYGGGYYDYFLAQHPDVMKIGVGFPMQLVKHLPNEPHDIPVDLLVLGDDIMELKAPPDPLD